MTITYIEFNASDLNRTPAKVFQAAKNQPVLLKRRTGQDMILVSKKELLAQAEAHETAALLVSAFYSSEESRAESLRLHFPWIALLNDAKQDECAKQLLFGVKDFLASGLAQPFVQIINDWKSLAQQVRDLNASRSNEPKVKK